MIRILDNSGATVTVTGLDFHHGRPFQVAIFAGTWGTGSVTLEAKLQGAVEWIVLGNSISNDVTASTNDKTHQVYLAGAMDLRGTVAVGTGSNFNLIIF